MFLLSCEGQQKLDSLPVAGLVCFDVPLLFAQEAAREEIPWILNGPWIPFLLIGVMFYLLLIRPERRKREELSGIRDNLKKNDRVVTIGGIHGVVVNAPQGAEDITLRIDESTNTRLRIRRAAVERVIDDEEDDEE